MQSIRMILLVIAAGWMGLLVWRYVAKALQGGTVRYRKKIFDREENPLMYWLIVFGYALLWGLIFIVASTRLMEL